MGFRGDRRTTAYLVLTPPPTPHGSMFSVTTPRIGTLTEKPIQTAGLITYYASPSKRVVT